MKLREALRHELIGLNVAVVDAKNSSLIGIKGKVVNETKNTITIQQGKRFKKIMKNQARFDLKMNKHIIRVNGELLVGRPEERLKK